MLCTRKVLGLLPLLVACSPASIDGSIAGEEPDVAEAFFFHQEDEESGANDISVFMSSVEDSCAAYTQWFKANDESDDASELASTWSKKFPKKHWLVALRMRVDKHSTELDKGELFDGLKYDARPEDSGEVAGRIVHFKDKLDETYLGGELEEGGADDYFDSYATNGGTLEVLKHTPGESLRATFKATVASAAEGTDEGTVTFSFDAERCKSIEKYSVQIPGQTNRPPPKGGKGQPPKGQGNNPPPKGNGNNPPPN